ncbi:MAG: amino acid racemase [Desulfuromonadaceae bacterium]|nr:amino acid racemase [Desulfuromonadaceae bacterium]
MQKIGIIGGLGPEATVDYYKRIMDFFHEHNQSLSTPEIIIYSVDIAELFELVTEQRWDALAKWLINKVVALENAGADFAVISANTPHIVFDQVQAQSPLPLISIVEATLEATKLAGFKTVGLLGTQFTMQSNFFGDRFANENITVVVPDDHEQQYIQDKLVTEIELGIFNEATRQELLSIITRTKNRNNIDAVILGCTELPLILNESASEVPLLNTTAIHVAAICEHCMRHF